MVTPNRDNKEIRIEDLYPDFTPEQLEIAEENLTRYAELVLRIYERLRSDPEEYARFKALTDLQSRDTIT